MSAHPRQGLFVRIPQAQAQRLDRASARLGTPKQDLITGLLEQHLKAVADDSGIGRHSFQPYDELPEVLGAAQAADLLQVDKADLLEGAEAGEIPGRKIGKQWRFSRTGLLEWLAASE